MEAAPSAWIADECNRVLGEELTEEKEKAHSDLVREAKGRGLGARKSFEVPKPLRAGDAGKTAVGSQWVSTLKTVKGVKTVGGPAWRPRVSRIPT